MVTLDPNLLFKLLFLFPIVIFSSLSPFRYFIFVFSYFPFFFFVSSPAFIHICSEFFFFFCIIAKLFFFFLVSSVSCFAPFFFLSLRFYFLLLFTTVSFLLFTTVNCLACSAFSSLIICYCVILPPFFISTFFYVFEQE